MKTSKMRMETLLKQIKEKRLPVNPKLPLTALRRAVAAAIKEYLEHNFRLQCKADILPEVPGLKMPGRNLCHLPGSKLEFDFSWASCRVAIEIQGGIDSRTRRSGHVSPEGMRRDIYKIRLAQLEGWVLLPLCPEEIMDFSLWHSRTVPLILKAIANQRMRYCS